MNAEFLRTVEDGEESQLDRTMDELQQKQPKTKWIEKEIQRKPHRHTH